MDDHLVLGLMLLLAILLAVLVVVSWRLHQRLSRLTRGSGGASLEDSIQDVLRLTHELQLEAGRAKKHRKRMSESLLLTVQTPPTVRFNPFQGAGSDQSFATALVNAHGDGVVLSSMYAQGQTSIFAKPTQGFQSNYELTAEEAHVLQQAKNQVS